MILRCFRNRKKNSKKPGPSRTQILRILTMTVIEPEKLHCYNVSKMRAIAHLNIQKG